MDDPIEIVNSAIEQHTNMIKQMKGVPGNFMFSMLLSFQKYDDVLWLMDLHMLILNSELTRVALDDNMHTFIKEGKFHKGG